MRKPKSPPKANGQAKVWPVEYILPACRCDAYDFPHVHNWRDRQEAIRKFNRDLMSQEKRRRRKPMTIAIEGKSYELFPKGWINVEVCRIEDKGMMSYNAGDEPKPKLIVHLHPENSQDPESTISVWCTNSCHPDATLSGIFLAAVGRMPRLGEDAEGILLGRRLKILNDHRVNAKDGLTYNRATQFAPPDPPAARPGTKSSVKPRANGGKVAGKATPVIPSDEITDEDLPDNL